MNRRFLKLLTLWMLPLLVARAIVPVGFMFMSDAGGLRLMFCPAVVESVSAQMDVSPSTDHAMHAMQQPGQGVHDMQMHAGHLGHAQHEGAQGAGHDKTPCPFSLAASVARMDLTYVVVLAALVSERVDVFETVPDKDPAPVQSLPIRGPPVLS